jgi:hypothetical protein
MTSSYEDYKVPRTAIAKDKWHMEVVMDKSKAGYSMPDPLKAAKCQFFHASRRV